MDPSQDVCAICLGSLAAREGQALFTAECSHTFHFSCIASNVQHGNHICPTCRSAWTNLPSQFMPPANNSVPAANNPVAGAFIRRLRSLQPFSNSDTDFADDEPLPPRQPTTANVPSAAPTRPFSSSRNGEMTVKAMPEYPALSKSEHSDSFSVLVSIHAPPLSPEASDRPDARAPIDLIAVLDVSGSMNEDKIRLLKQAMGFVIDNLGPMDRLSVITFATSARRVTPLRRMTDAGKTDTSQAVNSIRVNGSTNIIAGLKKAVQVLEQRRQKNPVTSIILLSDGQDNQNGYGNDFLQSLQHLPHCIRTNATDAITPQATPAATDVAPVPVHTFGFGSDHDATALHAIADGSGGTFSYIESIEIIQDAFAQCIGGLLSVVAQQVEINVQSGSSGVQIQTISSGRYRNNVDSDGNLHGIVSVGDVYAEEEKQFLVNLSVPQALASSSNETDILITKLLEVKCSYKDPMSNENIMSETVTVEIRRPPTEDLSEADRQFCLEVDRERNRFSIAEGIEEAQIMADRGELHGARELLRHRRKLLQSSRSTQAGDNFSGLLDGDVREIEARMTSRAEYEGGGKAYAYSKRSSHNYQRASTQALSVKSVSVAGASTASSFSAPLGANATESHYQTSTMLNMVRKSRNLRQSSKQSEPSGGSSSS